jgi:curved DNA-binding protein CbpA
MTDSWDLLGIEPTENKAEVKQAYANKLKEISIEEEPEKFQQLREAYEQVLAYPENDEPQEAGHLEDQVHEPTPEYRQYDLAFKYTEEMFGILKDKGEKPAIEFFKTITDPHTGRDLVFLEHFEIILHGKLHSWDEKKPNDLFYTISRYFGWIKPAPPTQRQITAKKQSNPLFVSGLPYGLIIFLLFIFLRACA